MVEGQEQNTQRISTQTVQNYDYIQYRLNNQGVVQKFEDTLSGIRREYVPDEKTQEIKEILTQVNKPLINTEGMAAIVGYFSMMANSSTVQGNLTTEQLNTQLFYISRHVSKLLAKSGKRWDCLDTREMIHNQFLDHLNIFLTRPKDNLERESYVGVRQQESTVIKDNAKKFGFI